MLTASPFAGCTSTALSLSLKVSTALVWRPLRSGTLTRRNEVSSARLRVLKSNAARSADPIFFTVSKVYRNCEGSRRTDWSAIAEISLAVGQAESYCACGHADVDK